MKDFVPLFQTLLWVCLALGVVFIFRKEIALIRKVLAKRLEGGASLELGFLKIGELRAELDIVRRGLNDANEKIGRLFLAAISPWMYQNLRKLASGRFGSYEMSNVLERELYHLRDVGYIKVESISAVPRVGTNLSDYVKITTSGEEFVKLREILNQKSA